MAYVQNDIRFLPLSIVPFAGFLVDIRLIAELQRSSVEIAFSVQQMIEAVDTIHEERIVHSDLKPANFLLLKGSLKLIDFGIAKTIMSGTTNIQRDAQVDGLPSDLPLAYLSSKNVLREISMKDGDFSDFFSTHFQSQEYRKS